MSRLRAADLLTMAVMAAGVSAASAAALVVVQREPVAASTPVIVLPRVEITVPRPKRLAEAPVKDSGACPTSSAEC